MKTLLIGCGNSRKKRVFPLGRKDVGELVTLDINPFCKPDYVYDLECLPYPFEDEEFDEIHAYEVLEHMGQQGDYKFFFDQWNEFRRIMKPGGFFCGSSPALSSRWLWGDPGHTRAITPEALSFLTEDYYDQVGDTCSTDYRPFLDGYWNAPGIQHKDDIMYFVLQRV